MNRRGFTLFELLVVIAVLGLLAAMSVPRFADFRAAAYDARSQQDLRNLASVQELYRATHGSYAARISDLASFAGSEGVRLTIDHADTVRYQASAEHDAGRHRYRWTSDASPPLSSEALVSR